MKILELRFKNLNSLYGEWIIDFTDPEYVSNGIFALTGPTGAGKSTILDAICLALYGATPRLGKITGSGNEIMSRQTGECYAEVLFESQAGRFRCHWEQRRARKKADGNLQDQEHQISDAETGIPIETKKSLVVKIIEEKTGMDFDRFTRSILLAQGGFDTFLKADIEQKSRILEQITGTEIYSEISRRVHERYRDEQSKMELLQAETSGILILDSEEEKEIHESLDEKKKIESNLTKKYSETAKAISWLSTIKDLKQEILILSEAEVKLKSDIEKFKPEREKLGKAMKAASLDGVYATLSAFRKQQFDDKSALKTDEDALPELEKSAKSQAKALKTSEKLTLKYKEKLKVASPLIQKIRALDLKLADQARAISEGTKVCVRKAEKIETDKKIRAKEQRKLKDTEKKLGIVERYLKENENDEWLVSGLAGIEEQFANLLSRQKEIDQKETDLKNAGLAVEEASKKLETFKTQVVVSKQELEAASKRLKQGKDALSKLLGDKLLREYRTEKENLLREIAYINKIKELEDYRDRLEDGKPCPLCGSIEHPYAVGNIPVPDEIEQKIKKLEKLIDKAEKQEVVIKKLEGAELAARNNLNDIDKQEMNADNEKKAAERILMEANDNLKKLQDGFKEQKLTVLNRLQSLGITEIKESKISLLLDSLKSRLKVWQENIKQKSKIEKQISNIESELKRLDAVIETQLKALTEKEEGLALLKKDYDTGLNERQYLYGDKNPDEEENRLNKIIEDAEKTEKKEREKNTKLQQELMTAKANIEFLKKRIEKRLPGLKKAESDFSEALESAGFVDEEHFLESKLTNEEREALSSQAKELDDIQTELKVRQRDRETCLRNELNKKITDKTLEKLEPQLKEYEDSLKELRDTIAGIKHKLDENALAKERMKEKQIVIEAQKKECQRWEKLHGLIGSADGKKYRSFAQGLTFELMVSHANRQLEKMTDRYLLIRDEKQPLELNVIDNYQAGEIRSTKNLSGGESFIVSLTLALGLSKMASRKVRVDSLFLDEGFGTLDDESLDTALETLASLQQDGKLIGIISHVSALKERIATQITVTPISGGRSTLAGPGCSKISKKEN
jgi:exonuclease SbcC